MPSFPFRRDYRKRSATTRDRAPRSTPYQRAARGPYQQDAEVAEQARSRSKPIHLAKRPIIKASAAPIRKLMSPPENPSPRAPASLFPRRKEAQNHLGDLMSPLHLEVVARSDEEALIAVRCFAGE